MYVVPINFSIYGFPSNSEANASELLGNQQIENVSSDCFEVTIKVFGQGYIYNIISYPPCFWLLRCNEPCLSITFCTLYSVLCTVVDACNCFFQNNGKVYAYSDRDFTNFWVINIPILCASMLGF